MPEPHDFKRFRELLTKGHRRKWSQFVGESPEKNKLASIFKEMDEELQDRVVASLPKLTKIKIDAADQAGALSSGKGKRSYYWAFYYYLHRHQPLDAELEKVDNMVLGGRRTYVSAFGQYVDGSLNQEPTSNFLTAARPVGSALVVVFVAFALLLAAVRPSVNLVGSVTLEAWIVTGENSSSVEPVGAAYRFSSNQEIELTIALANSTNDLQFGIFKVVSSSGQAELIETRELYEGSANRMTLGRVSSVVDPDIGKIAIYVRKCSRLCAAFFSFPNQLSVAEAPQAAKFGEEINLSETNQWVLNLPSWE